LFPNQTVEQVFREFRQFCAESGFESCEETLAHSAYAYDGLWALGLALNRSLADGGPPDKGRLLAALWNTDFQASVESGAFLC
jgi:hypothetical protein